MINEYKKTNNQSKLPIVNGDLIAIIVIDLIDNVKYILASFHGDTNGLATIPVVNMIYHYATLKQPDSKLLFGMDANTYTKPEKDQQGNRHAFNNYNIIFKVLLNLQNIILH